MSSQTVAMPTAVRRAGDWLSRGHAYVATIRPLYALSTLVAVQWAAVAALAVTVRHNGWVYYMGGDQLWHYTSAYLLAHREIAPTLVGYGWSTLLVPIARFAGFDLVSALPAIVILSAGVLLPIALVAIYGIASRIGGRVFGYWVAVLWVALPFAGIPYAVERYHQKYTELTLPQILGLGAMSDLPSVVALLVGAYLCLRALDERDWRWGAAAGFAVGYSLSIKPSNAVFLFAPAIVFLIYRWRTALTFAAGLVPPLALLAFWKFRGYGTLPAFAHAQASDRRIALGILTPIHKYTHDNSWTQLHNNLLQLREFFWSDRLLEFAVIAGVLALLLRSRRAGLFVGVWFFAFLLLKGTYFNSRIEDATFWRLMLPAFPAFILLVASVPLLFPGVRLRPPAARTAPIPRRIAISVAVAVGLVLFAFPLAVIAAAKPVREPNLSAIQFNATLVPIVKQLQTTATLEPNGVLLQWPASKPTPGNVFYRVLRTGPDATDEECRKVSRAPDSCIDAVTSELGTTRAGAWLDRPPPGRWTYRVGLSANWLNDPSQGDVYAFGPHVVIDVPAKR